MAADDVAKRFERRATRARRLAETPSSGLEPLRFAARLFEAQGRAASAVLEAHRTQPLSGRFEADAPRVLEPLRGVLRFLAEEGPPALREVARAHHAGEHLAAAWSGAAEDFAARLALRAYAEPLACLGVPLERARPPGGGHCPACGEAPAISFRRAATGTDGAARWLGCGLCGTEWQTTRIRCPACGETDPERLPGWQADGYPAARVEACERCHRYLKSVDLSVDATAVPEVDELRSLGLDLWAMERGFTRLAPGLAGV